MTACKYWDCGWCYAPNYLKTNAINSTCVNPYKCPISPLSEPVQYETPMTENEEKIEKVKAQIKVLEKKLALLEELEKTKSPVEEAYNEWYGEYPPTSPDADKRDIARWHGFQAGYEVDYAISTAKEVLEEVQEEPEPSMTNCVITGNPPDGYVTWNEWYNELGSKGILHNLRISSIEQEKVSEEQKWDTVRESVEWCEEHQNEYLEF